VGRPEVLVIKVFRSNPDDVGIGDAHVPGDDLTVAEQTTARRLEGYFSAGHIPARKKPTQARLLGQDGRIIAEFRMTPSGPEKVNRIAPDA
jgi:hypothetical protein